MFLIFLAQFVKGLWQILGLEFVVLRDLPLNTLQIEQDRLSLRIFLYLSFLCVAYYHILRRTLEFFFNLFECRALLF